MKRDEIDQSLYSRVNMRAGYTDAHFFGIPLGMWDQAQVKKLTGADTNMWASSQLVSGQEFLIDGIRFKEADIDSVRRMHLMQHAFLCFGLPIVTILSIHII